MIHFVIFFTMGGSHNPQPPPPGYACDTRQQVKSLCKIGKYMTMYKLVYSIINSMYGRIVCYTNKMKI